MVNPCESKLQFSFLYIYTSPGSSPSSQSSEMSFPYSGLKVIHVILITLKEEFICCFHSKKALPNISQKECEPNNCS